jgi:hypothetical protein
VEEGNERWGWWKSRKWKREREEELEDLNKTLPHSFFHPIHPHTLSFLFFPPLISLPFSFSLFYSFIP